MYDIAIVGAGPAGSTLARMLADRSRVLLLDREAEEDSRVPAGGKLCGGLLAPMAQKELARQGLGVPADVLCGPQLFAVRTIDIESGLERKYQRHYLNIDRRRFDGWLRDEARKTCDFRAGWRVTRVDLGTEAPLLRCTTAEGAEVTVAARIVVGADGAASVVRRALFGAASRSSYVAVQSVFEGSASGDCYGAVFSASTDHYGWVVPKGDLVFAGGAFRREQGVPQRFERLVDEIRRAGFALGREIGRESAPLMRPMRSADVQLGRGNVLLIGEAAGLISPSSAEGISYALRSAAALAAAIERSPADPLFEYRRYARPIVGEVLGKIGKARIIGSSAARRFALATGVGSLTEGEVEGFVGSLGELLTP